MGSGKGQNKRVKINITRKNKRRILKDGTEEWRVNGKLHLEDGPALIHPDGGKEWWVNDQQLNDEEIKLVINKLIIDEENNVTVHDGDCYF